MLTLFFAIIFGLLIAFFAIQNNATVVVKFIPFSYVALPLYVVVILSMLIGLLMGWILSFSHGVASFFALRGKDSLIANAKKREEDLRDKIRELELKNAELKGEHKPSHTPSALSFK